MIRRASAKLENSFVTANFVRAWAQLELSKLERQQALPPNCGQIMKKQLFIFPNSLTIHHTSTLHNTFYFHNTWTKIQLRSDHVNMQPDKTKCYPQRPITTYGLVPGKMLSTSSGSPPLNSGTYQFIHVEGNSAQDLEGSCSVLECHISHHKAAGIGLCTVVLMASDLLNDALRLDNELSAWAQQAIDQQTSLSNLSRLVVLRV